MEGIFFLADIILMLLLALAIFRGERKDPPGDLGLFVYKQEPETEKKVTREQPHA